MSKKDYFNQRMLDFYFWRLFNSLSFVDPPAATMNPIGGNTMTALPQSQAVYAKVQRRPRSPSITDVISNASSKEGKCTTIHVTLHKDRVYDDYGFSLSDGLYEKGVYINRIRSGGPADVVHLLKPFDRILLVSGLL